MALLQSAQPQSLDLERAITNGRAERFHDYFYQGRFIAEHICRQVTYECVAGVEDGVGDIAGVTDAEEVGPPRVGYRRMGLRYGCPYGYRWTYR